MKRFSLLPLVAFVFAVACTDSTAPANSRALLNPGNPALAQLGDPPPPPVDAMIVVCVGSCVLLEGEYFANGGDATLSAAIAKKAAGEGVCVFPGSAWLKFDNKQQPQGYDVTATSNARIKCSHQRASGGGTIEWYPGFGEVEVILEEVLSFDNMPDCSSFCGSFTSTATVNGAPAFANGNVFNREYYEEVCGPPEEGGESVCNPAPDEG